MSRDLLHSTDSYTKWRGGVKGCPNLIVMLKVKFALEEAMKAQRGSGGTAPHILYSRR